jgi:hypothetical protein
MHNSQGDGAVPVWVQCVACLLVITCLIGTVVALVIGREAKYVAAAAAVFVPLAYVALGALLNARGVRGARAKGRRPGRGKRSRGRPGNFQAEVKFTSTPTQHPSQRSDIAQADQVDP